MKRRMKNEMPEATINLTSLMDITFVLLIAFMIVAPAVKYNVDLELPKSEDAQSASEERPIQVQVAYRQETQEISFHVNGRRVPLAEVAAEVKRQPTFREDSVISLEGERIAPWEEIARLITHLNSNGISNIAVVTELQAGG